MKNILLIVLLAATSLSAQTAAEKLKEIPKPATVVEQITASDVHDAVAQIASELAEAKIAIQSLRRQAAEWKARALKAESVLVEARK